MQTIIGRPVSEKAPLADLSAVEQDYVFQTIQQTDPLTPQARAQSREQVDPVTGVTIPRSAKNAQGLRLPSAIPNFAAVAKPVEPIQCHLSLLRLASRAGV